MTGPRGAVAAGHPLSASAGADVLAAGGNAVDAALGAMLAATVCEPLLTGLGAGGYMLVVPVGGDPVLLDFFVEAPGRDLGADARSAPLEPVEISFGDAVQVFHVGESSVGCYGFPAGVCAAAERFGTVDLGALCAPAARLAREGVVLNATQGHIAALLEPITMLTDEGRALFAPDGRPLGVGDRLVQPDLADALIRLGEAGAEPFYTGEVAERIATWLGARGGRLGSADLAAYRVLDREPLRVGYRGREVLTNPPPAPGGLLLARALAELDTVPGPPTPERIVRTMRAVQAERTESFVEGLGDPGFAARFLGSRLGSTTHVAVLDGEGMICSVTCSNGASSGVIVPGTGVHLNNMLGETDLNPRGFHHDPPGTRMPSMMSPTVVREAPCAAGARSGAGFALALGSAGSNRIRSAILQTIVRVLDDGLGAQDAVDAARTHYEDGIVSAEPGVDVDGLAADGWAVRPFADRSVFFGGVQAVLRTAEGRLQGAGDPRRGGAAVVLGP